MDRKFVLKENFYNFLDEYYERPIDNDFECYFGISWSVEVIRHSKNVEFRLVTTESSDSNLWSMDVECRFSVVSEALDAKQRKKFTSAPLKTVFNCQTKKGQSWFVSSSKINQFLVDDKLTVTCEVSIIKSRGIREKRKQTFDKPIDGMTDVVLMVRGKEFHASKAILANMSPVFKAMFYGNFQESKMKEIKIEDVEPEDFENLLSFIHQASVDISKTNVSKLLKIADRFDVELLTKFCEKFVITVPDYVITIEQKLKLSEEFILAHLQDYCLKKFETRQIMCENLSSIEELGEMTVKALLKKSLSFQ